MVRKKDIQNGHHFTLTFRVFSASDGKLVRILVGTDMVVCSSPVHNMRNVLMTRSYLSLIEEKGHRPHNMTISVFSSFKALERLI